MAGAKQILVLFSHAIYFTGLENIHLIGITIVDYSHDVFE